MKKYTVYLLFMLLITSCASRLKKECEAKNWFKHGFDIAMTGHRTSGDSYVVQCQKEGAEIKHSELDLGFKAGMKKYCKPETSFDIGRNGKRLGSGELCEPALARRMKISYDKGLAVFCTPENGKVVGESGRKYDQVCPAHLEMSFVNTYKKGRKKYLTGLLSVTESKIKDAHVELTRRERDLRRAERVLRNFRPQYEYKREKRVDADGNEEWKTTKEETFDSYSERNRLKSDRDIKESRVKEKEREITELQRLANETQLELSTQF